MWAYVHACMRVCVCVYKVPEMGLLDQRKFANLTLIDVYQYILKNTLNTCASLYNVPNCLPWASHQLKLPPAIHESVVHPTALTTKKGVIKHFYF